ncbi:MAG: aminotransferase class V-fold PLP-dependent enzyme [Planctomycetes bacterium]|nr:aminotransferase class V-fold PLP-dependent enzyme [Planctomycetota bacterium]
MQVVYFDNNASTRVAPQVLEAMLPALGELCGNPSSLHALGQEAAQAVAGARAAVARLIGAASPARITFTSCGTEANATALRSAAAAAGQRRRIVTSAVEHAAVLEPLAELESQGFEVVRVGVDREGRLDPGQVLAEIDEGCALVSVMWANNETGVIHELAPIAAASRRSGALFHVDAVQAAGKLVLDCARLDPDFLTLSAHKLHGPKGIGALYARRGAPLRPLLRGGPQEDERRAGTENVPGIVGFGRAAQLAAQWLAGDGPARLAALRDQLERRLLEVIPASVVHGARSPRLPNTANLRFEGVSGEALLALLSDEGLCVSTGAACSSSRHRASHVLQAMGLSSAEASSSLRFSLSRDSTPAEVERAVELVARAVARLRALAHPGGTEVGARGRSAAPAE